ncbi:MAG: response regulator [Actinobacteria bacterium]|nr:response regulator [Actinomycetota bacterium]
MHILLVADEDWVREDVRAALGDARYEITEIDDPRRAVEACAEASPDVVIADLQVGAMGGMAVVRAVRGAADGGKIPHVPTVLLLDRSADTFLAGRAGADAAIRKPFGAFELRDLVDGLVREGAGTS